MIRSHLVEIYRELFATQPLPEAVPPEASGEEWNDKAISLSMLGYDEEACACYERAISASPANADIWVNYGGELVKLRQLDRASECLERGLQLEPDNPPLWKNKSLLLELIGSTEQARECRARYIDLECKRLETDWWHRPPFHEVVALRADEGEFELALQWCEKGLSTDRRDVELLSWKASLLVQLGHYEEAVVCCADALEIEPRRASVWCTQACALLNLGRLEEGLAACNRGLEVGSGSANLANLWENKGLILKAMGRLEESEKCFAKLNSKDV